MAKRPKRPPALRPALPDGQAPAIVPSTPTQLEGGERRIQQYGVFPGVDPLSGWTVESLAGAVGGHKRGQFDLSGRLGDDMASHPWVRHCLSIRGNAFTKLPLNVTPTMKRGDGRRCADFVRDVLPEILPLSVLRDLHRQYLIMGQAIAAIDWERRTDGGAVYWLPVVKPWTPQLTAYRQFSDVSSVDGGAFIATTMSHGVVRVDAGKGRWMTFQSGRLRSWLNGLVMTLGEAFVGDGYNFRDNMTHQDRYGRGIMVLYHPVSWKDEEVLIAANSLVQGGGGGVLPLPLNHQGEKGADLELRRADAAGWRTFDATEQRILRRVLVTVLGQDMTSIGQTGGYKQAVVHSEILWNKCEEDAATFGDARMSVHREERPDGNIDVREWVPCDGVLRQQLLWWIAQFNFGSGDLAPYVWWDATPPEDLVERAQQAAERGATRAKTILDLANAVEKLGGAKAVNVGLLAEQCGIDLQTPAGKPGIVALKPPAPPQLPGGARPALPPHDDDSDDDDDDAKADAAADAADDEAAGRTPPRKAAAAPAPAAKGSGARGKGAGGRGKRRGAGEAGED